MATTTYNFTSLLTCLDVSLVELRCKVASHSATVYHGDTSYFLPKALSSAESKLPRKKERVTIWPPTTALGTCLTEMYRTGSRFVVIARSEDGVVQPSGNDAEHKESAYPSRAETIPAAALANDCSLGKPAPPQSISFRLPSSSPDAEGEIPQSASPVQSSEAKAPHEGSSSEFLQGVHPASHYSETSTSESAAVPFAFLDMRDVLATVMEGGGAHDGRLPTERKRHRTSKDVHPEFLNSILQIPALNVANQSGRNVVVCIPNTSTLRDALRHLEFHSRVAVVVALKTPDSHAKNVSTHENENREENTYGLDGVFTVADILCLLDVMTRDAAEPPSAPRDGPGQPAPSPALSPHARALSGARTANGRRSYGCVSPAFVFLGLSPSASPQTAQHLRPSNSKRLLTSIDVWTAGKMKRCIHPGRAVQRFDTVEVCFEDETLFEALKRLYYTGFSALPIVAQHNPKACLGMLSVRDLLPIMLRYDALFCKSVLASNADPLPPQQQLQPLTLPVLDYMARVRQLEALKARYPMIHVRHSASLDLAIGKILATNISRLILTDDEGLMVAILSVTDLGRFMAQELAAL